MPIDWSLGPTTSSTDYLLPLQAMNAGRQAAMDTRKAQARATALDLYSKGDLDGAQRVALAGGDVETADTVRGAQARAAGGNLISQLYANPPAQQAAPDAPSQDSHMLNHSHDTAAAIGQAVAAGQPFDAGQAWGHLYALDPAMGDKIMGAVGTLDKRATDQLNEKQDALASAAQTLLDVPEAQRAVAAAHMLPQLAAHGITSDQLTPENLTDSSLHGIIGQSLGIKGLIEQKTKGMELGLRAGELNVSQGRLNEDVRHNRFTENQPVAVGGALVGRDGKVIYDPMGGGGNLTDPASISDVIGKIEGTARNPASSAQGYGQFTNSTFVQTYKQAFPDQAGMSNSQILAKRGTGVEQQMLPILTQNNMQSLTAAGIPATAANTYAAHFLGPAGATSVLRASPDTAVADLLPRGVIQANPYLRGMKVSDFQAWAAKKVAAASGQGLEAQANAIARGDAPPLTGRASVTGVGQRIMGRVFAINPEYDAKLYHGESKAVDNFLGGKNADLVRSMSVSMDHLETLGAAAVSLQNGNIKAFNSLAQHFAEATGNPAPTNFNAVKHIVAGELTKAIVGSGGALADRQDMVAGIERASSPDQLKGFIFQVQALMAGQLRGLKRQYEQTSGNTDFNRFLSDGAKHVIERESVGKTLPHGFKVIR
jgi:hypothetical protein